MSQAEIYFHTGLGKVASTWLQYSFFPVLKGIRYIPRSKYKKIFSILENIKDRKILISREFDRQFDREVEKFARHYPDATIIIFLRRHDSWMASQYRRFIKNGGSLSFEEFFDWKNNRGLWKREDALFYPKIEKVQQLYSRPPLVFLYDELLHQPSSFPDKFCAWLGCSYDKDKLSFKPVHTSYNEKQLKVMRKIARYFFKPYYKEPSHPVLKWIKHKARMIPRYLVLYLALLIPGKWVGTEPLIDKNSLEEVANFFQEDWNKCLEYVRKQEQFRGKVSPE